VTAAVNPERVLKELAEMWISLGKPGEGESGAGVLRACTMTLVVMAEESEDAMSLGETIAALMPVHPARTIVIRLRGGGERALAERVYAQCWMPFGQRRQICCEQVEITASDAALADLPPVVTPLAVPDLPLILWCRSARLAAMPEFRPIADMAHKVVLDSAAFADGRDALRRVAEMVEQGMLLGDLAWTRLTRWRESLSQVFENRRYLEALPRLSRIRVGFGDGLEVSARYMAAWLSNVLAGATATVEPAAGLEVSLEGDGFRVELARRDAKLAVTVNDLANFTNLPQPSDYLLMSEELGIVRHDPVFERTLASAARLAYSGNQ